jgi:tRNA(His) guanylyltransferase
MSKQKTGPWGLGDLQRSLERFETYNDGFILPDTRLVIRLDAHRFGDWSGLEDEYPCGPRITKVFHETAINLMTSSFRVKVAFVQGDEISLFLDPAENANPQRRSSIISSFSSAAAVHFLKISGFAATFNARLSELPSADRLIEYFLWQRRYCYRNAINIALRRALLSAGNSPSEAEKALHGVSEEQRIAHLEQLGIPLKSIPSTTLKGALFGWKSAKSSDDYLTIASFTNLSDDDDEFITLVSQFTGFSAPNRSKIAPSALSSSHTNAAPPSQKPLMERKTNRKTNVSVFKVSYSQRG